MGDRALQESLTANLRVSINNAYAAIKGQEATASLQAVTFDEMLQRQSDRITGKNGAGRSALEKVLKMKEDLIAAIGAIQNISEDRFFSEESNKEQGVNT